MTPSEAARLFEPRVVVSRFLCQMRFVRWRKNHRKSRINKKWHKKYGPVLKCEGRAYRIGGDFHVCPCVAQEMRKSCRRSHSPTPATT